MNEKFASLPELALTTLPSDPCQAIIIKRGEMGYRPFRFFSNAEDAEAFAARYNERHGIAPKVAEAMAYASCFGWSIPLIDELLAGEN